MRVMASYHCTVKAGASSSASAHAAYIEREGKYKSKDRADLEANESGNLPSWAERSSDFWKASDSYERANAKGYREYEVALPREMTPEQRLELVRDFVRQELGDRHAYTFAIHNPRAALEGGEQPHAHIMFSERQRDSIERSEDQYFKRWNAKNPEKGGCKKGDGYKPAEQRKAELVDLRERWAELQNKHLEHHGHADRVDHRTLQERGIDRLPVDHLGPTAAAMEQRGLPTRRGRAHALHQADMVEVASISRLESQLEVDRRKLIEVKAEQTKPNIDAASLAAGRAAFRAKYEEARQAKDLEAKRQAETRNRNAQKLLVDQQLKNQEQKQIRQMEQSRGPDLSR